MRTGPMSRLRQKNPLKRKMIDLSAHCAHFKCCWQGMACLVAVIDGSTHQMITGPMNHWRQRDIEEK